MAKQGHLTILWSVSLALWLATLISTPLILQSVGDGVFPLMTTAGVLLQTSTTLIGLASGWPLKRVLGAAAVVFTGAWSFEAVGASSGFPFGHYTYTDLLQPKLGDVPLLIPFAWLMMIGPAWAITSAILSGHRDCLGRWDMLVYAALAGLVFTVWDLYLDPQMVSRGLWVWDNPRGYFGIPWHNFVGWWATAALLTLLIRPPDLSRVRLMTIYTLTWGLQAFALAVFWGQPGPALVGFVGMGTFVIWAWFRESRNWTSLSGR